RVLAAASAYRGRRRRSRFSRSAYDGRNVFALRHRVPGGLPLVSHLRWAARPISHRRNWTWSPYGFFSCLVGRNDVVARSGTGFLLSKGFRTNLASLLPLPRNEALGALT